jgi:hypothetical protein
MEPQQEEKKVHDEVLLLLPVKDAMLLLLLLLLVTAKDRLYATETCRTVMLLFTNGKAKNLLLQQVKDESWFFSARN